MGWCWCARLNPGSGMESSPVPWMMTLPSIVAANLESEGKLTGRDDGGVIEYTRGEYATTLVKGPADRPHCAMVRR